MTITEVNTKKIELESVMQTALTAAKALQPATPEFDDAYGRYLSAKSSLAKIPDELAKAKQSENKVAIDKVGATVAEAINELVEGLKVAELLGTPIIALRYFRTPSKDAQGVETVSTGVVFNPITVVKATSKATPKEGKGSGHNMVIAPDGTKLSLTKFVLANATEAEKASPEFKYPHTRADSKPKFEAFCLAHNLVGYTYEVPGKAKSEEPAS